MAKKKKSKERNQKIIGLVIVLVFLSVVAYFFTTSIMQPDAIPSYVTGETREVYVWSKTPEGRAIMEQVPCFCGCKFEGHRHSRDCFWREDGSFDKHGITCSICIDVGSQAKRKFEEGKDICQIRKEIEDFYEPSREFITDTPWPEGCPQL